MFMENEDFRTPGQMIEALLADRGWTQRVLAIILGVGETGVNKLIAGKQPLTADMALLLCEVFDLPSETAEKFLELEKRYELAKARMVSRPDPSRAVRARIFGGFPITEMSKRGWLDVDDIKDVPRVERSLAKFFKVDSVNEIEIPSHAAKKTNAISPHTTPAQLAWIYRVREIADDMLTARYSPSSVRNAVSLLNRLLSAPEEARKVPRILAECGIRYVIVETLPSAKIDGVCFWLNDSPVIGMSLRYDRIDNFWFVLRHEMEHVLQNHGKAAIMVCDLDGDRSGTGPNVADEERIANEAAAEFCVPQKTIESFIARKSPFFSNRDILGLANTLQIHPGLIAGQLQHRTGRYDRFRQHQAKIRYAVTPGAAVDGWGDIFPVGM